MKTACYLSLIILYYHRSLSNILTIYATNCPCDELSVRRIVHATNCPCDELSMRRIVRDELSVRRIVRATNCPCDELSSHRSITTSKLFSRCLLPKNIFIKTSRVCFMAELEKIFSVNFQTLFYSKI